MNSAMRRRLGKLFSNGDKFVVELHTISTLQLSFSILRSSCSYIDILLLQLLSFVLIVRSGVLFVFIATDGSVGKLKSKLTRAYMGTHFSQTLTTLGAKAVQGKVCRKVDMTKTRAYGA